MKTANLTACGFSLKSAALIAALIAIVSMGWGAANATVYASRNADDGYETDIRVWMEDEYDIYSSEDNLVFYMRAARDCYATVYVVDTDGFIHVIHPFSPYDNAFIRGGIVYRFTPYGSDIFYSFNPRGIAYVFAVASPAPFIYADFGIGIFGGTSVFRIYGDPFIACRQFHVSILPRWVMMDRVSVSCSYFYIREWARFPRYLCHHRGANGCGIGSRCGDFDFAYNSYRTHHNDPCRALRPSVPAPHSDRDHARIVRVKNAPERSIRAHADKQTARQTVDHHSGAVSRQVTTMKSRGADRAPMSAGGGKSVIQRTTRKTTQRTAQRTTQLSMQDAKNSKQVIRSSTRAETKSSSTRPSSIKPPSRGVAAAKKSKAAR